MCGAGTAGGPAGARTASVASDRRCAGPIYNHDQIARPPGNEVLSHCSRRWAVRGRIAARPRTFGRTSGVRRLPRFYFQVIEDGVEGPLDEQGIEYPSIEAAERDTEAVIADMMGASALSGRSTIEVVISDENRRRVARVKISLSKDRMS